MKVDKLSISFDPELGDAVQSAARPGSQAPYRPGWRRPQRASCAQKALAKFPDGWEAEHGVLTTEELARAERELGMAASDSAV